MTGKRTNLAMLATGTAIAIVACTLPATAEEGGMGLWPKGLLGSMSGYVPPQSGLYTSDVYYHFGTKFSSVPVTFAAKWERDVDTTNTFKGDVVTVSATASF